MQFLWREVFEGNRPLTVDEFLFCYKPFEINQSLGFYQFTARGKDYRLIKSLVTSYRNWKTEFFFVSSFWARRPIEVDRDPFPPYTGELGNLRPEGMFVSTLFSFKYLLQFKNPNSCFLVLTFYQVLDDLTWIGFILSASRRLVYTLTGRSTH